MIILLTRPCTDYQSCKRRLLKLPTATIHDHYVQVIIDRWEKLASLSTYLAVDDYFAKQSFVDPVSALTDLRIISKLRCDANLKYLYHGPKTKGRGQPKKYDGKVDLKKIDKRQLKWLYQDQDIIIYEMIVWSVL